MSYFSDERNDPDSATWKHDSGFSDWEKRERIRLHYQKLEEIYWQCYQKYVDMIAAINLDYEKDSDTEFSDKVRKCWHDAGLKIPRATVTVQIDRKNKVYTVTSSITHQAINVLGNSGVIS